MLIKKALKKAGRMVFHTNSAFWFERGLSLPIPEVTPKLKAEINLFSRDETISWLKKHNERWVYNRKEIAIASKENHYYPHIKYDGKIIGYMKAGLGRVYIEDYAKAVTLPKGKALIYDTYVLPPYRGLNLAAFMITEMMKLLRANGIEKVNCHIPGWNTASIRAYTKAGFQKVSFVRHLRIFNWIKFEIADEEAF